MLVRTWTSWFFFSGWPCFSALLILLLRRMRRVISNDHWNPRSNPLVRSLANQRSPWMWWNSSPFFCTVVKQDANLKKDTIKLAETPCVKIKSALNHHFLLVKSTIFGPACRSPMTAARVAELSPGERPDKALKMAVCSWFTYKESWFSIANS